MTERHKAMDTAVNGLFHAYHEHVQTYRNNANANYEVWRDEFQTRCQDELLAAGVEWANETLREVADSFIYHALSGTVASSHYMSERNIKRSLKEAMVDSLY